jgi:hypothetical protein
MPVINSFKFVAAGPESAGYVSVRRLAPGVTDWDATVWLTRVCRVVARQAESPRLRETAAGMAAALDAGSSPQSCHERFDLFGNYPRGFSDADAAAASALTEARYLCQNAVAGRLRRSAFGWGSGYYALRQESGMTLPELPPDARPEFTFPVVS